MLVTEISTGWKSGKKTDMDLKVGVRLKEGRRNRRAKSEVRKGEKRKNKGDRSSNRRRLFWGLSIEAISTDWLFHCVTQSWSLETLCVSVWVKGWGGLRASAVVRTGSHAPLLETLQLSHIVKPQSPQRGRLHFVGIFLLLHPVLNLRLYLFGRTRERRNGFLMRLERKACVVCMVRGLAFECYAWSWLFREVSTSFSPSEFWGGRGLVRIFMAWGFQPQFINVAAVINKGSISPTQTHSCTHTHNLTHTNTLYTDDISTNLLLRNLEKSV